MKIITKYVNEYTGEVFESEEECRMSEGASNPYMNFPKFILNKSCDLLSTETLEDKFLAIVEAEFVVIENEAQRNDFNRLVENEEFDISPIQSEGIWRYDDETCGWHNFAREHADVTHAYRKIWEAINAAT